MINELTVLFDDFLQHIDGEEISLAFSDLPAKTKTLELFEDEGWLDVFRRQLNVFGESNIYDAELIDALLSSAPMAEILKNCLEAIKAGLGDSMTCFSRNRILDIASKLSSRWYDYALNYVHESNSDLSYDLEKRLGVNCD